MERMMHRLLLAWALLWGACILTQVLPFPGSVRLGYWFFVVVALTSPVVLVLLFLHVAPGLRKVLHRLRVLRRAVKWKRKEPLTRWPEE